MVTENQIYSARNKLATLERAVERAGDAETSARSKFNVAQKGLNRAIYRRADAIVKEATFRKELINKGIYEYVNDNRFETPDHVNAVLRINKETLAEFKNKF